MYNDISFYVHLHTNPSFNILFTKQKNKPLSNFCILVANQEQFLQCHFPWCSINAYQLLCSNVAHGWPRDIQWNIMSIQIKIVTSNFFSQKMYVSYWHQKFQEHNLLQFLIWE